MGALFGEQAREIQIAVLPTRCSASTRWARRAGSRSTRVVSSELDHRVSRFATSRWHAR